MYVYFDPDNSVDWVQFFQNDPNQAGTNGFRAGSVYQRGNGALSQLLGKLFISAVPLLRKAGSALGSEMLNSSLQVASDVADGGSFKTSLAQNASKSYDNLLNRAINRLSQKGGSIRRRKRVTKRKPSVKRRKRRGKAKKPVKRRKPAKKSKKGDIFGKWPN